MPAFASIESRLMLVGAGAMLLASASRRAAEAESTTKQVADAGVWMVASYKVSDYARWKPVHDRAAAIKRFAESIELRDEMAASGVASNPEIRFPEDARR